MKKYFYWQNGYFVMEIGEWVKSVFKKVDESLEIRELRELHKKLDLQQSELSPSQVYEDLRRMAAIGKYADSGIFNRQYLPEPIIFYCSNPRMRHANFENDGNCCYPNCNYPISKNYIPNFKYTPPAPEKPKADAAKQSITSLNDLYV